MKTKRDYGRLLTAFDGKVRKVKGQCAVRLPSWDELLRIDREAEADAARAQEAIAGARTHQNVLFAVDAVNETKSAADAAERMVDA